MRNGGDCQQPFKGTGQVVIRTQHEANVAPGGGQIQNDRVRHIPETQAETVTGIVIQKHLVPRVAEVMRDLSGIGSTVTLTLVTLITVGYLSLAATHRVAFMVAISVASGAALMSLLKIAFGRLRPEVAQAAIVVPGLSFPSGHSSMAAIVFLTLGTLIASTRTRLRERSYILAAAALLALLVGVSRVMLGVHWATDVLGGWAFGAGWAMAWLLLVGAVMRKARGTR